ncbi:hypothetical protein HIM_10818 [Hirsutella minnesotensis 3608]|uniref:LysM domain-containing protein n=1 Tax=Hirsutella minnesotensis 3608 TaxID=1043627 RepID=A0A0F7ZJP0_9HYPO|nr:hypothetical protein HIM_10818 [Hirsutella minnesotensis 3608]
MDTFSFKTLALAASAAVFLSAAEAQIFLANPDGKSRSIDAPDNVSSGCKATFGTSVKCNATLSSIAFDALEPSNDILASLCKDDCLSSLQSLQSSQKDACKNDTTTLNGIRYPATYMTDSLLFTFNYICLKDSSNQFCAPQVDQWASSNGSASEGCKDCVLRTFQAELDSPLGYDADLASYYSSLTSSCGVTKYPISSPAPYTLPADSTTTSGAPAPTAACASHYTVKAGDNCNSVSTALGVSTSMLQYHNNIAADCSNFPIPGTNLCVPATCKLYTLQTNETCFGISQAHNGSFSATQLISWNPRINRDCSNLEVLVGTHLCVSAPGDASPPDPTTIPSTTATPTTVPTDVVDGTNHHCGKFYKVAPGDTCSSLSVMMGISLKDFYFLNPEVNKRNCSNLLLGYSYCVQPVGDIGSYPGYGGIVNPCVNQIPLPASCVETGSVSTVSRWEFPTAVPKRADPNALPLAAGTKKGCATYVTYLEGGRKGSSVNACYAVASVFETNITDFISWNPSLKYDDDNPQNCVLAKGYRYCAQVTVASPTSAPVTTTTTSPGGVTTPTPIQEGMVRTCSKFYKVKSGDGCYDIAKSYGIALNELYSWNPALKGDCSGLFPDVYICVGSSSGSSSTHTTTTATATTPPRTTPSPVQDGIVKDCGKFYKVKSGDGCYNIAQSNSIALSDLYSWNPALKGDCSGLFPDYYICVGRSATPTTSKPPANSTPTPVQDGMVKNCKKFYKVKSGDGCYNIAQSNSIALNDFYLWNPAVKSDCSKLFPDYNVCVGI